MHKRERLEKTIAGEKTDRLPIALWRHYPGDDQRAADFARAIYAFQKQWNFDFVKVTPSSSYCVLDYGVQDRWVGSLEGTREYTKRIVSRSLDWTELRRLEPTKGSLGQQVETLHLLGETFGEDVPFIHTIYSPLTQAGFIAGQETLIRHLRTHPDRLKTGLNVITDNTLRYIDALSKTGIAGIFYEIAPADYAMMSESEYREFGCPYDLKILDTLPREWWLNIGYVSGQTPMLEVVANYPIQALSWNDREGDIDLAKGKTIFAGAVCGGLGRWQPMNNGMPGEVRAQVLDAIEQAYGLRLIISTSAPLIVTSPRSHIRTAREIVEEMAKQA